MYQSNLSEPPNRHRKEWKIALKMTFSEEQWLNACNLAHKCSISSSIQETSYKILTNWYFTPAKLHAWYPEITDTCWRCGSGRGNMMHIWWDFPLLRNFWDNICTQIYTITKSKLKLMPECCLLNICNYSLSKYKKSVVRHMLNTAKSIIPKHWKNTQVPTVEEWLLAMDSIYKMEETATMASENTEKLRKLWRSWYIFRYSDSFEKLQNG